MTREGTPWFSWKSELSLVIWYASSGRYSGCAIRDIVMTITENHWVHGRRYSMRSIALKNTRIFRSLLMTCHLSSSCWWEVRKASRKSQNYCARAIKRTLIKVQTSVSNDVSFFCSLTYFDSWYRYCLVYTSQACHSFFAAKYWSPPYYAFVNSDRNFFEFLWNICHSWYFSNYHTVFLFSIFFFKNKIYLRNPLTHDSRHKGAPERDWTCSFWISTWYTSFCRTSSKWSPIFSFGSNLSESI